MDTKLAVASGCAGPGLVGTDGRRGQVEVATAVVGRPREGEATHGAVIPVPPTGEA